MRHRPFFRFGLSGLLFGLLVFAATPDISAQRIKFGKKGSPIVGRVQEIKGALLKKRALRWLPVSEGAPILTGTQLVSFPKSEIRSSNGAVELLLVSDLGKQGVYPVLESSIVLKRNRQVDLDVTFQRGIMVLTNIKTKGPAKVKLRMRDSVWELTLKEPGTKIVAEMYSRHPPGRPNLRELKLKGPMSNLVLLVVKGKAFLQEEGVGYGLSAPPGPALVFWDNVQPQAVVQNLKEIPPQIKPPDKKLLGQVSTCASCVMSGQMRPVLQKLVESQNKVDRLVAVTMQGAIDDIPGLIASLNNPKHADAREHAIVVLRNWMGREPGQVKKLYLHLVKRNALSRVQALSALQLLFGFDEEQWRTPGVYQMLIQGLHHEKLAARQLSYWHLVRLAPSGKNIPYDPAGPVEQRQKAIQQWQKLIPQGNLAPWLEKQKEKVEKENPKS